MRMICTLDALAFHVGPQAWRKFPASSLASPPLLLLAVEKLYAAYLRGGWLLLPQGEGAFRLGMITAKCSRVVY